MDFFKEKVTVPKHTFLNEGAKETLFIHGVKWLYNVTGLYPC